MPQIQHVKRRPETQIASNIKNQSLLRWSLPPAGPGRNRRKLLHSKRNFSLKDSSLKSKKHLVSWKFQTMARPCTGRQPQIREHKTGKQSTSNVKRVGLYTLHFSGFLSSVLCIRRSTEKMGKKNSTHVNRTEILCWNWGSTNVWRKQLHRVCWVKHETKGKNLEMGRQHAETTELSTFHKWNYS